MNCSTVRHLRDGGATLLGPGDVPEHTADVPRGSASMIHVDLLRGLCEQLEAQGLDVSAALAWADCNWQTLGAAGDWTAELPLHWIVLGLQRHGLTTEVLRKACRTLPMDVFGPLATALATAARGRDALALLHQHVDRRWPTVDSRLEVSETGLWWRLQLHAPAGELRRFLLEGLIGCCSRLLAHAVGTSLEPQEIDASGVGWHIGDEWLDRVRPNGPAAAFDSTWADDGIPVSGERSDLAARVEELLEHSEHGGDIERIAEQLGIASRTLSRRLARDGLSFQTLLENWRKRQARVLLEQAGLPIAEVARRLGYRSAANFSRSAKRWMGRSSQGPGRGD